MDVFLKVWTFLLDLFWIRRFRLLAGAHPRRSYRFVLAYCWMALIFYVLSIPLMTIGVLIEGAMPALVGVVASIVLFPLIVRLVVRAVAWMNGLPFDK